MNGNLLPDHVITESSRLRELISFANAHREIRHPFGTVPSGNRMAKLYDGERLVMVIGSGGDFLYVNCQESKGIRSATTAELAEFERLIRSE